VIAGRWLALAAALLLAGTASEGAAQAPLALVEDSLRVVYWPGDEGVAQRAFRTARAPLRLPGIGTAEVLRAGTVILAPDAATFDSVTGGRAPDWAAGVAIPALRTIILPAYPSTRTRAQDPIVALRHEMVHLALNDYLGVPVPRWFDEGYATWASGEWDASAAWQIRFALLRGAAPPLDSISLRWPAAEPRARIAYLLSASAVEYLATRNGEPVFATFLATWRRVGSIGPAMRATYYLPLELFEREWRRMVVRRYGWLLAIAQVGFFWAFVTVVFLAVGWRRRVRDRERLAEMRVAEEGEVWIEPTDDDEPPEGESEERRPTEL
jgi:hypothetical protein